uniref:Uncharacterized protein n=1 Tax=Manihot esculenta TaxID=3983 RepID=A0A251KVK7_MANES
MWSWLPSPLWTTLGEDIASNQVGHLNGHDYLLLCESVRSHLCLFVVIPSHLEMGVFSSLDMPLLDWILQNKT